MMSDNDTDAARRNWTRTTARNVSDILGMAGTVREWTHDTTGDTIAVKVIEGDDGRGRRYNVEFNGEPVTAYGTLQVACDSCVETLRHRPDGLEGDA